MSSERFDRAMKILAVHEGGYSNHKDDPGGATNFGITQKTYDDYNRLKGRSPKSVKNISKEETDEIFRNQYWNAVRADDLPDGVAYCVFDAAVNSGPGRAARWLQKVIGAKVDGVVGDETISMARGVSKAALINTYCDNRLAFMKRLSHWSVFGKGWSRRVSEVRAQSLNWAKAQSVPPSREKVQPKAEGPEKVTVTIADMVKDPRALSSVGGLLGSAGALTSGEGPIQYALAAVLVLGALAGVWWLVRGREQ